MIIAETDRLIISLLTTADAPFILELLNDPSWLRFIGDRGVNNEDDARNFILNGPIKNYESQGFGMFLTKIKKNDTAIGLCGLLKRDFLDDVDVGFAFLPQYSGKGYAFEAASATIEFGRSLGFSRIVGVTSPDNERSMRLLRKLGMQFEKMIMWSTGEESSLFGLNFTPDNLGNTTAR